MPTDPAADTYTNAQLSSSEARLTLAVDTVGPRLFSRRRSTHVRSATPDTQFTPKALDRRCTHLPPAARGAARAAANPAC